MGAVPDAVAQHVDGAALGNLSLQPREKLAPRRSVLGERERFGRLGLGCAQEGRELGEVNAVLTVVVVRIAAGPAHAAVTGGRLRHGAARRGLAGMTAQCGADEAFEAALGRVGRHASISSRAPTGRRELGMLSDPRYSFGSTSPSREARFSTFLPLRVRPDFLLPHRKAVAYGVPELARFHVVRTERRDGHAPLPC